MAIELVVWIAFFLLANAKQRQAVHSVVRNMLRKDWMAKKRKEQKKQNGKIGNRRILCKANHPEFFCFLYAGIGEKRKVLDENQDLLLR